MCRPSPTAGPPTAPRNRPHTLPCRAGTIFEENWLPAQYHQALEAIIFIANQRKTAMAFTTTASGLQYEDTTVGDGAEAAKGQQVAVHYTGWLYNDGVQGAKFDSSRDRNDPFIFGLGAGMVIKGWDEGVQGMKAGGVIPPNATLKFDVELLNIGR